MIYQKANSVAEKLALLQLVVMLQVTVRFSVQRARDVCPYCGSWYDPECAAAELANGGRTRPTSSARPASSTVHRSQIHSGNRKQKMLESSSFICT